MNGQIDKARETQKLWSRKETRQEWTREKRRVNSLGECNCRHQKAGHRQEEIEAGRKLDTEPAKEAERERHMGGGSRDPDTRLQQGWPSARHAPERRRNHPSTVAWEQSGERTTRQPAGQTHNRKRKKAQGVAGPSWWG